jgi:hypothetical protein
LSEKNVLSEQRESRGFLMSIQSDEL